MNPNFGFSQNDIQLHDDVVLPVLKTQSLNMTVVEDRHMPLRSPSMHVPNNYGAHNFLYDLKVTKPEGNFL